MTKSGYIAVSNGFEAPVAAFSAFPTFGSAPITVSFTDQSTGSPTSRKWTFGDGTYSTGENPVHKYSEAGLYSVTLTASNADGSNTLTKSSYIIVSNVLDAPATSFSASPTSGNTPITVGFTGQSKGSPTSWKWSFGDGNTSTDKNTVHTFNKSGLYSVTLTASNAKGSSALTKSGYIAVSNVLNAPITSFSASLLQEAHLLLFVLLTRAQGLQRHGNGILEMETLQQIETLYTHSINQDYTLLH